MPRKRASRRVISGPSTRRSWIGRIASSALANSSSAARRSPPPARRCPHAAPRDKIASMSRRRAIESALVLLAVGAAIVPVPATIVERWFSTGIYPRIQQVLTALTNLVPFAWFDVILITAVAVTATTLVRMGRQVRRERHWRPLRDRAWQFVVAASVLYVLFLACWGLNYRRVRMSDRLDMLARSPGREDVLQLGMTA